MNEIIEKMLTRHAIRRFQDRPVEEELLEQILQAGLYAPSAGNRQLSRIVVCKNREINAELGRLSRYMQFKGQNPAQTAHAISADQPSIQDDFTLMDGFYGAPVVMTIFSGNLHYAREDAAIIAENMLLAAHFLGLGACYIGRTDEVFATEYGLALRKEWQIPEDFIPVCSVILGYPAGRIPGQKPRREGRVIRIS